MSQFWGVQLGAQLTTACHPCETHFILTHHHAVGFNRLSPVSQYNRPSITCACFTGLYVRTLSLGVCARKKKRLGSEVYFSFSLDPEHHTDFHLWMTWGRRQNKSLKADCFKLRSRLLLTSPSTAGFTRRPGLKYEKITMFLKFHRWKENLL